MRRVPSPSRLIALSPLLALALAACGGDEPGAGGPPGGGMPPTTVETVVLKAQPLPSQFETVGTLRADEAAVIRPEVDGRIIRIHFQEGQPVADGAMLFTLDPALVQADLNEANANLENSRRALARANELAAKQLIARSELDNAKAQLAVDEARAASARTRLSKTQIRAPFAGVAGLRTISEGDYVNSGQALIDIVRLDPMEVDLRLPETVLSQLAVGQAVVLGADAYREDRFNGIVAAIAPTVDAGGRSVSIRARIGNPDGKLKPGMSVRARIVFATKAEALLVPEQAIWPNGDQKAVYVVRDGTAKLVPVTLGARQPGTVEITSGLKAGDEVITSGQQKIFDGAKVATAGAAPAKPEGDTADAPAAN
jgi:membrane fusion protein (multidrug efflux system)